MVVPSRVIFWLSGEVMILHRSGRFLPGRKGEEIPQDSLSRVG
jgi:hypothetical protein